MSRFTGPLKLWFYRKDAALLEPLVWDCDEEGSGLTVVVPVGFRSDGVTVPRAFWWFLPPFGDRATRGALLHDYLLSLLDAGHPAPGAKTRAACDRQLLLALRALKVPRWRCTVVWLGVRAYSIVYSLRGRSLAERTPE